MVGGVIGMAVMLWLLFQTGRLNMGAALIVASGLGLFALGGYSGLCALRQSPNWAVPTLVFWLAQVPLVATPAVTYYSSASLGAWMYMTSDSRIGWSFYFGSQLQLSLGEGAAELIGGVNLVALAISLVTGRAVWRNVSGAAST
jgi:hypothetical protein